jgi:hypothetical protein
LKIQVEGSLELSQRTNRKLASRMKGWLSKKPNGMIIPIILIALVAGLWHQRFFVADSGVLYYFKRENDTGT